MQKGMTIGSVTVRPGQRQRVEIPVSRLPTETWLAIPVEVVCGTQSGPCLWLSAAVHGDELNGVEIIRQVLRRLNPQTMSGTLIAVPIVNVFGFIQQSRYLPDRRDLNRSFPGSSRGSMAARLAQLFMKQVVEQCTHGIDLHTGSNCRTNWPQIRGNLRDAETRRCAELFAAPVMMHAETRDGSLRQAATNRDIHVLLFEAGEPLRFDSEAIRTGVDGVQRVMAGLQMILGAPPAAQQSVELTKSRWIRAARGGILRLDAQLGQWVKKRERLGVIADVFGDEQVRVIAPQAGMIIGQSTNPLVNQGDGIINIGS